MQRLADSGQFSDLSYTVGPDALVFDLKPILGKEAIPVRFGNLVWWQPAELESLLEARVPLFHGQLPLTGQLTDQVEAALTALLAEKGIRDAHVGTHLSTAGGSATAAGGMSAVVLSVTAPPVTLGQLELPGTAPAAAAQMQKVIAQLSRQEFDAYETSAAIMLNTVDTHRNVGYLDATVDPPVFSVPRKQGAGYVVDGAAFVHPGSAYHVSAITFDGVPPGLEEEVAKSSELHPGDPAGEMTLHIGEGLAARSLQNHGMLDAEVNTQVGKDTAAHTISYHCAVEPGPVYTIAGVDASALPADQQHRIEGSLQGKTGAVADSSFRTELLTAIRSSGAEGVSITARQNRATHSVTYVLAKKSAAIPPANHPG